MKKFLVIVLVCFLVFGAFLVGNKTNINIDNEPAVSTKINDENTYQITEANKEDFSEENKNQNLSREDFYLYKEEWLYDGGYTYREDGQILTIENGSGIEAEFTYDENGLIETASDNSFGSAHFQYDFIDGCYVGYAYFDESDTALRYTYDDNYRLILREEIYGSDVVSYEILYNYDGFVFRTIEKDWLMTVKNYGENGMIIEELIYNNDNELTEEKLYDSDGKMYSHKRMYDGEVYEYSKFKKEGDTYVEYIYNEEELIDSYYVYIERKYDNYGNLIWAERRYYNGTRDYTVSYEYKLKAN